MELLLQRFEFNTSSTIGKLYLEDKLVCHTLEDRDRGLKQDWELATILSLKIPGETAIPIGRYEIDITYSNRFKKPLPLLKDVKGFEGIRIHTGNVAADTDGCILVGEYMSEIFIRNSRKTYAKVFKMIGNALLEENVFITILK